MQSISARRGPNFQRTTHPALPGAGYKLTSVLDVDQSTSSHLLPIGHQNLLG